MKNRKKKVYIKWFASYLAILLLPIMIGVIIYARTLESSRQQADSLNRSMMQIVKNEFDHQVDEINKNMSMVAFDNNVQMLSNARGQFTPKEQYMAYELYRNLKNINLSEEYCEDVFVYFKNTDTVVSTSGSMQWELYYNLFCKNADLNLEQLKDYLSQSHYRSILPIHGEQEKSYLLFTMTSLSSEIGETTATIGIRMNIEAIDRLIENVKWDQRVMVFVMNQENHVLNNPDKAEVIQGLTYDEIKEGDNLEYSLEGERYIGSVMNSAQTQWKYLLLTPEDVVEGQARQIQKLCVIGLFACLFIGFFLSYYLTRINYNPLKGVLEMFKGKNADAVMEDENEYQWLTKQAQSLFKEHTDIRLMLACNKQLLKDYYLFRLLEYAYDKNQRAKHQYHSNLTASHNVVLLFSVGDFEDGQKDTFDQKNSFYKFIVTNIFTEMISEHFNAEMTDVGETAAAIINMPDNSERMMEVLKETAEFAVQTIEETFKFRVVVLMGSIHEGMNGIHVSYLEAREAEEYISLLDTSMILYSDIKNTHKNYDYPIEMEEKIINAIKACDSQTACSCMDAVLDINCQEKHVSADIYKCLVYDMMGTVMKGADKIGYCGPEEECLFKQISVKLPPSEIKQRFHKVVQEICQYAIAMRGSQDTRLSEQVIEYIEANYQDPDLNISQTGFYFHMTPTYLSGIFKAQTEKSLLKYINTVRIEHAQRLLNEGCSVVETAQKVGFRDSGAFIRVFKKFTGVTPGQMKKMSM